MADTLCGFIQVLISFFQSTVNFAFTPFAWFGLTAPSVAGFFQVFYPFCTFQS